jgi:protein O-GlcNAc transferase
MERKNENAIPSQNSTAYSSECDTNDVAATVDSIMSLALQYHQAGLVAEAENCYQKILRIAPNHIGSLHNLGLIALGHGRYEEAIKLIEKAITLNEHIPHFHNSIGAALGALGRLQEAIGHYRTALTLDPSSPEAHNNLGNALSARGNINEAVAEWRQALALKPDLAEAHNNLGNALKLEGKLHEAVRSYESAINAKPNFAEAYYNLGIALQDLGELDEAARQYRCAFTHKSNFAKAHSGLGNLLKSQSKFDEALLHYRSALDIVPDDAEAHNNLAEILQNQGQWEEAISHYQRALSNKPTYVEARKNLGHAFQLQGRLDDATAQYQLILTLDPHDPTAHSNLANTLQRNGRLDEAIASYRRAITLSPGNAHDYNNLGSAFRRLNKIDEAAAQYQRALEVKPNYAEAHNNLGNILQDQGDLTGAERHFRSALSARAGYAEAHNNLGNIFRDQGRLSEAVTQYQRAVELKPELAEAHNNLGAVLKDQGIVNSAIVHLERALLIKPDFVTAHSNLLFCLMYDERLSSQAILAAHKQWNMHYGRGADRPKRYSNDLSTGRRLKIGYVSGDFRQHPVASFFTPVLAAHDHHAIETFCYGEIKRPDDVTRQIEALADHWRVTVGLPDESVAAQISNDRIDILIDLAGHTAANRLAVFARKPAPVQVNWLGYPNSTGLSTIDYRLVDKTTDPEDDVRDHASEKLVRLDGTFLCYGPPNDAPPVAPPPSLENGLITFGSFNNPTKYSADTIKCWASLLAQLPEARLLLKGLPFADASTRSLYCSTFAEYGLPIQQLILLGRTPDRSSHLALYRDIDIALDPFPYNGTTTTCEALWMGVPVVTLRGRRHSARVGASLMGSVGLDGLIASDFESYVEIAVRLARDRSRLLHLRNSLRGIMQSSPLCDARAFARKLEGAYRTMWQCWCQSR